MLHCSAHGARKLVHEFGFCVADEIDVDHQLRKPAQPLEIRIGRQQLQELAGTHDAVLPLVIPPGAFHQRTVQLAQRASECVPVSRISHRVCPLLRSDSLTEIEQQYFGAFAVLELDLGHAGQLCRITGRERFAVDGDLAARDVDVSLAACS